jgi:hypothetical protein
MRLGQRIESARRLSFFLQFAGKTAQLKKPPHQVRNYPADHKILDDTCASAGAVITCRRVLSADLLDLLLAPTTTCSP